MSWSDEPGAAPYVIAGRRMYVIGVASGELVPIGNEHLVGGMGGVWAHPFKVADGLTVTINDSHGQPLAPTDAVFTERLVDVGWQWRAGPLAVQRDDAVSAEEALWRVRLQLHNAGREAFAGQLIVETQLLFLGAWFSGLSSAGATYWLADNLVLGYDQVQSHWGIAFGAGDPPQSCQITVRANRTAVRLAYALRLAPDQAQTWEFRLAVGQQGGWQEAERRWHTTANGNEQDVESWGGAASIHLDCAEATLTRDFALAQANLRLLQANYPDTGAYFLAGLPEFAQFFGCDTTYTVPGAVAAGFTATTRQALLTLAAYAQRACGRVPHELTTNGRVFHPGNIQETPQLTIACWDYLRWTGDLEFARQVFPVCREGMLQLLPALCGPSGLYPLGDGMVERLGMGVYKLDSACYASMGLVALAQIAQALGDPAAPEYWARAALLQTALEHNWWLEDEGLYADSMHSNGKLQLDGHWTIVVPVQLGLAAPERAIRMLDRIEREWVNEWGLVHTREREERVWTLPTGLLALAEFAHGRAAQGWRLLQNIALTAQYGTLGAFKELIPEGLCFVQLWSAGLYLQGVFEGLLGLRPDAPAHRLEVAPSMPAGFPPVHVHGLRVGAHRLDLVIGERELRATHTDGPQALTFSYRTHEQPLAVGETFTWPPAEGGDATTNGS